MLQSSAMDKDLKNKTMVELTELVKKFGGKGYLAGYIFSFIHTKDAEELNDITPLPKAFRSQLADAGYYISKLKMTEKLSDPDGTVKYAFELCDGLRIETVVLVEGKRSTLCISSQAGCRRGCAFCATGKGKFGRNLTAGEIVDQVNQAAKDVGKINNVVYMGMGEPMDNFEEVIRSVSILNDEAGKNIGQRHITISTCGIVEGIDKLAERGLQVRLAVSLHASEDRLREKIMAVAKKYPLKILIEAVRNYQRQVKRRVTFEYCMIKDLNDSTAHGRGLIKVLSNVNAHVNLIEYNPHPGCDFAGSEPRRIYHFAEILKAAGIETSIRYKRGAGINAACGQLGGAKAEV